MDSCVIQLTSAAHDHGNLNIRPCGKQFFPKDVFGGPSREAGLGVQITLKAAGLPKPIKTDIPTDKKTGRPRWIFRERKWVKEFLHHHLRAGDTITIQRIAERTYKIRPNNGRATSSKARMSRSRLDNNVLALTTSPNTPNNSPNEHDLFQQQTVGSENCKLGEINLDARRVNILNSPKKGGSSTVDSIPYLRELNIKIIENAQPIQFYTKHE